MIHHAIFGPFRGGFAGALDTAFTLLPQYLQRLGMQTHMVGKWHLGFGQRSQLPRARGFDSYLGYWNGAEAYYNHTVGLETSNGPPSPDPFFLARRPLLMLQGSPRVTLPLR